MDDERPPAGDRVAVRTRPYRHRRRRPLPAAVLAALLALTTTHAHAAQTWTTAPALPTARFGMTAVTAPCPTAARQLKGTCVYVAGGFDGRAALRTTQAYSPATGVWATLPDMPTARSSLTGAAAPCPQGVERLKGECVYAIGGNGGSGVLSAVEAYSPATGVWAALPGLPTAREALAGAAAPCPVGAARTQGVCVYAMGGFRDGAGRDTVEAYSPRTGAWTALPALPTARFAPAGAAAPCPDAEEHTCVYVIGGRDSGGFQNRVETFRPATGTWATAPALPTARDAMAVAVAPCPPTAGARRPGCVYTAGGFRGTDGLRTAEVFGLVRGGWAALPALPTGRYELAGTGAPCPGAVERTCVYAIGGHDGGGLLSVVEVLGAGRQSGVTGSRRGG
ncbi:Kelch repeat-containing protein [Streptomyces gamaensis]|uniref:Kelch repeat-containing protein n=1 Tax=Streptomyces gamaensis TaxID=1763542 RepID=A0ABW0YYT5_9ACTN